MPRIKHLASSVAKLFIIAAVIINIFSAIGAQQRPAATQPKPAPSPVYDRWADHKKFHRGQDYWTWSDTRFIFLKKMSPEDLSYWIVGHPEKLFSVKWTNKTLFDPIDKDQASYTFEGKCYFLRFCKVHKLALLMQEKPCPEKP